MKKLLLPIALIILSCSEEDSCEPTPKLTTFEAEDITDVSATISGTITPPTCDEASSITSQGFVYSRYPQPEIDSDSVFEINGVNVSYTFNFNQNTTYYVRTYLENINGVYYGNEVEVSTTVGNVISTIGNFKRVKSTSLSIVNNRINSLGGGSLKRFGVCWSTNNNPTIQDNFKEVQGSYNNFDTEITNLEKGTIFYFRTFGENEAGVFYGNEKAVSTSIGYTDYEGNFYETVLLEDIIYTASNLSTSRYSNGDEILKVNNLTEGTTANQNGVGAWCYYNFDDNNSHLGKLYNWYAISDDRGIGVGNWVIPSEQDLQNSFDIVGGFNNSPKSTNQGVWGGNRAYDLKEGGESGFDALSSSTHMYDIIQTNPIFKMYSSSLYFNDRYPDETFVVTRALTFDNSIRNDKVLVDASSLRGAHWIPVRLINKN